MNDGFFSVQGLERRSAKTTRVRPEPEAPQYEIDQRRLLAAVKVELSVEIARVSLTLSELLDMSAGSCIEFALPEDLPVGLHIDGVQIASGRIVYDGTEPMLEIVSIGESCANGSNKS